MKQRLVELGGISQNETSAIHLDWHNFRPLTASSMLLNICRLRAKHHVLVSRLSRMVPCCQTHDWLMQIYWHTFVCGYLASRFWFNGGNFDLNGEPYPSCGLEQGCLVPNIPYAPLPLYGRGAFPCHFCFSMLKHGSGRKPCPAWSVCPVHNGRLLNIRLCTTSMANHRSFSTLFQTDDSSLQPQSCSSFGNDPCSSLRVETEATTWQRRLVSRKWSGAMAGTNNWSSSIKQGGRKRAVRAGYYFHWKRKKRQKMHKNCKKNVKKKLKKKAGQLDREKAEEKA